MGARACARHTHEAERLALSTPTEQSASALLEIATRAMQASSTVLQRGELAVRKLSLLCLGRATQQLVRQLFQAMARLAFRDEEPCWRTINKKEKRVQKKKKKKRGEKKKKKKKKKKS